MAGKTVKSLQDLNQLITEVPEEPKKKKQKKEPKASTVKKPIISGLGLSYFQPTENERYCLELETEVEIRTRAKRIGLALEKGQQLEDLALKEEVKINEFINGVSNDEFRKALRDAYFFELVKSVPLTFLGLQHVTEQGIKTGLLLHDSNGNGLSLPAMTDNGGWRYKYFHTPRGYNHFFVRIDDLIQRVWDAERRADEQKAKELKKDVIPFIQAIEQGGETVFVVPSVQTEGKKYLGGTIRVSIENGLLVPIDAAGRCQNLVAQVKNIIRDTKIKVRVLSLKNSKEKKFSEYVSNREFVYKLEAFWHLCHRAWEHEIANPPKKPATTVEPQEITAMANQ